MTKANELTIPQQVSNNLIHWSCFECADKHRTKPPYDGTVTIHNGTCDICKQTKPVASARKLFGYHKFL